MTYVLLILTFYLSTENLESTEQLYREQINFAKVLANDKFILEFSNQCKAALTVINSLYGRQSSKGLTASVPISADELS